MKFSEAVLADEGMPNLLKIINQVTKRMKNFTKQNSDPVKALNDVKQSISANVKSIEEEETTSPKPEPPQKKSYSLKPKSLADHLDKKKEAEKEQEQKFQDKIATITSHPDVNYSMDLLKPQVTQREGAEVDEEVLI